MPRTRNNEPPSFLSTLSDSVQESSLLILDAYEHRLREGKAVPPASLEELRKELDKTPSFEGSLEVTLRLLKLQEQANAHDASTSSTTTRTNQDTLNTSLRPPSPLTTALQSPKPTKYAYSPFTSPNDTSHGSDHQHQRQAHPWYYSPSCSSDYSEQDLLQPGWREEEEDEAQLARRRSQVRVRRLPTTRRISRHRGRRHPDISDHDIMQSNNNDTPPHNTVRFKDQAQSVIHPEEPRPSSPRQGGPTPDYQLQFKDQAQSVIAPDVIPVAIAVPIFDEPRHYRPRRRRRQQQQSRRYHQLMSI